jgi:Flp pilus assembly protein TadG
MIAVECALLVTLVFVPMLAGVVNFGLFLGTRHTVVLAASEAVKQAVRGNEARAAAEAVLAGANLDLARATIEIIGQDAGLGEEVRVLVAYDLRGLSPLPLEDLVDLLENVSATASGRHL